MQRNIYVIPVNIKPYQPTIKLNESIREIKKLLRLRMNGVASTVMRTSGLNYQINFGLDAMSIREIASHYKPDTELAERLWKENARECKILATLLYPRNNFTPQKADEWLKDCFVPELTEQLCFNLLQHLDFAPEKAMEWIQDAEISTRTAGYTLMLRLLLRKTTVSDLDLAIKMAEKDRTSEDFRLQQMAERFFERAVFV